MAAANDVTIEGMMGGMPGVRQFGLNTNQNIDFSGVPTLTLPTNIALPGNGTINSGGTFKSASQFWITGLGIDEFSISPISPNTNPVFHVNTNGSGSGSATGLNIIGQVAGSGLNLSVLSPQANENLVIDAKGTGNININTSSSSSGIVVLGNGTSRLGLTVNGPVIQNNNPTAFNSTGTVTAAALAGGYITSTTVAGVTMTLPTGTAMGTQLGAFQGTIFDFTIDNTAGANTFTVAAAVNGIVSAAAVANGASQGLLTVPSGVTGQGQFRIMFSSATAYSFSRIA